MADGVTQGGEFAYREYVRVNLDRALEILAHMSFADFSHRIDPATVPDDEFGELFNGLELVMEDLADTRKEIDEQHELAILRGELWRTASVQFESSRDFAQGLLETVGPHCGAKRVSYFTIDGPQSDAVCAAQWVSESGLSTIGIRIPAVVWGPLKRTGVVEIDRTVLALPQGERLTVIMERTGISSLIATILGHIEQPRGFIMFTHAQEHYRWTEQQRLLLGELAHIVLTKSSQIEAERALRESNIRLELEVARRTEELARTNLQLQEDIRRREHAEQALREREELYRGLVETTPDAIFVIAPGGGIVMANGAAVRLLGAGTREDLIGRGYGDLVSSDDRARFLSGWNSLGTGNRTLTVECTMNRGDGSGFLAESRSVAIGAGEIKTVLSIVRDITELRRIEEERVRSQKLESLGLLAGGIAHDFNNVLTGIVSNLAMAKSGLGGSSKMSQALSDAEEAAMRATGLTRQLLTFARGGAPVKVSVDVREMVENSVRFCLSGSSVRCCYELPETLAPVEVDRGQLDQVLNNIFINAVQAMPAGGTVTVRGAVEELSRPVAELALRPGRYVRLSITDNGPGIAAEHLSKLFDPYFTTKKSGVGLGLTTAYSVIRRHGGAISCESGLGRGATFTMYLPAADHAPKPEKSYAPERVLAGTKVLIMDDDRGVRLVLERLLARAGYTVCATTCAQEALSAYIDALANGGRYEAVLLDLTIPGEAGGREVLKELLKIDSGTRAIVVSGYSNDPVMADFRSYGFRGMLAKPFRVNDLLKVVAEVAGQGALPRT